jgi:hypothetical protein
MASKKARLEKIVTSLVSGRISLLPSDITFVLITAKEIIKQLDEKPKRSKNVKQETSINSTSN